ncbi:nucleoside-diphosphate sugar epimerase/dehydratase [Actinotalea sp. K2]|uniref:nucleoside-diphosphate sugar epimerase/dehydratase n=1 Tax=Actinotalea sp. K2 TaxID=2939438 RepID=UPI0020172071|nr:nucleoside-diphosphate sugar epimerase/dehydratase [Actinotalea sp. K2]MCL3862922.1 polysaccharide biosynthesis protein [Actinotalea sp. K2]
MKRERLHRSAWAVIDALIWFAAILLATWLRFDFDLEPVLVGGTLLVAAVAVALHVAVGFFAGPYAVSHQRGSFEESSDISRTVAITAAGLAVWAFAASPLLVPRSVPLIAGAFALTGMFAGRFLVRSWRDRRAGSRRHQRRVIVFGAGNAGRRLLRSMVRDEQAGYFPVALLDDDRSKRRLRIDGVRVRGTREDIAEVARAYDASALVVALPSADAALVRELSEAATAAGLDTLVLPPLHDIIGGKLSVQDLRDVNLEDILGRQPIVLDTEVIAGQIAGRRVLVTGAGGSIGSELCRQIARFDPAKLYLLDRDESGLQATQMSLTGQGLLEGDEIVLADIRDLDTLREVFGSAAPDIVFHAAALKHLPLLESFPLEAWKSNVLGTLNVLTAAAEVGVGTFVNISTDKAADPTCVLGYSKRTAERLTADFSHTQPGRYVSVRFGNVLGSRGSVVHLFTAQIERGGPVTVTHPDVERYFMLIPEACQLVLEAGSIGADGEVMVLEMGDQVRIVDVATTLIAMSGRKDVEIRYTGLRPGEKLTEELFSVQEPKRRTANPLLTSVPVPRIDASAVRGARLLSHDGAGSWMREVACPPLPHVPASRRSSGS